MKFKVALLATVLLAFAVTVSAHHGSAAYEMDKSVTVKGTITDFQFVNPHVLIFMDVKDGGKVTNWAGELTSPNRLTRLGWNKDTLKVGDEVTMVGAPSKSGAPRMWANKISNASGPLKVGGVD
ncbi:MAG TPA: DUF6152 family protein [Gemmataceae bacterium]